MRGITTQRTWTFALTLMLAFAACLVGAVATAGAAVVARGSAEQAYVTGAPAGANVVLLRKGKAVRSQKANFRGGALFRRVEPGGGYAVRVKAKTTKTFRVLTNAAKPPSTQVYDQTIGGGYGYMRMRDGIRLAINVSLPGPVSEGPYPTLIEYSGYGYADPDGPESGIGPVANLLGYAVVDVNMRGTGCSGGAFDYFERLQSLDGYDIIETVARQPWVFRHKVGMLGISYGGISQLFVGATRPPSLAAIAPLSVIDSTQTTLYPGGILNTGFALSWGKDRVAEARVAGPNSGQPWAWEQIEAGDTICDRNQDLHPEAANLLRKIDKNRYYRAAVADPLAPVTFVDRIKVPTFLACQWTDEQTGGHCATLASRFTGTRRKWFTFTNGVHTDALAPETFNRWFDFLELYVARRKPSLSPTVKAFAPFFYEEIFGVEGVTIPDDPIQQKPTYAAALAAYEKLRPVRILFDNGAGRDPYQPYPGYERSFARFPPPTAKPRTWWFGKGGFLTNKKANRAGAEVFTWNPDARPATDFNGNTSSGPNGLWTDSPAYQWTPNPAGTALAYRTPKLSRDVTVVGSGEVQLWVRSKARNVDLQATITEIRPDGKETFVQSGWLRTEARKVVAADSTLGDPYPDLSRPSRQVLPKGRWVLVRVPLYYQGHAYRKNSRIRVIISAPGGDQPIWRFDEARPDRKPWVAVGYGGKRSSRLVLPVIRGMGAPTGLPPCPGLRGEPCRPTAAIPNKPFGAG